MIILYLAYIALGFGVIISGSYFLVNGSVKLAKLCSISPFIIGATIVAYGTSAPELFISIQANLANHSDLAYGNIVGSNIANILLVLACAGIFREVVTNNKEYKYYVNFLLVITAIMIGFVYFTNTLGKIYGVISALLLIFMIYMSIKLNESYNSDKKQEEEDKKEVEPEKSKLFNILKIVIVIIIGLALLPAGATLITKYAVKIADIYEIPKLWIGVTIVALGGSLPELFSVIVASIKKEEGLLVGGIIGSNIFNTIGVGGVASLIKNIDINFQYSILENIMLIFTTLLLYVIIMLKVKINRIIGVIMLMLYIAFIVNIVQ